MASYPGALWDGNLQDTTNDVAGDDTIANAADHNEIAWEVIAIETDLRAAIASYGGGATSIDDVVQGLAARGLQDAYNSGGTIITAGGNDVVIDGSENLALLDNNFVTFGDSKASDAAMGYATAISQMYVSTGTAGNRNQILFSTRASFRDDADQLKLDASDATALSVNAKAGSAADPIFALFAELDNEAGTARTGDIACALGVSIDGHASDGAGARYYGVEIRPADDKGGSGVFTGIRVGTAWDLGMLVESGGVSMRDDVPLLLGYGTAGEGDYQLMWHTSPSDGLSLLPVGGAGSERSIYLGGRVQVNDGAVDPYPADVGVVPFRVVAEAGHASNDLTAVEGRLNNVAGTARTGGRLDTFRANMDGHGTDSGGTYVAFMADDFAANGGSGQAVGLRVEGSYTTAIDVNSGAIDLDPTGAVTLDMDAGQDVTVTLAASRTAALLVQEGSSAYLTLDTSNDKVLLGKETVWSDGASPMPADGNMVHVWVEAASAVAQHRTINAEVNNAAGTAMGDGHVWIGVNSTMASGHASDHANAVWRALNVGADASFAGTSVGLVVGSDFDLGVDIQSGGIKIAGDLDHDGTNAGWRGATPIAAPSGWSITNYTSDRTMDCDGPPTAAELADVLATLVLDLINQGLLAGSVS